MTRYRLRRPVWRMMLLLAMLAVSSTAIAQDSAPKLTVRDVNVFVMSAYGTAVNHRDLFRSTLPSFASPNRTTADRKHLNEPSPAGLMTFEGTPAADIDVLLEFDNGRFFANWPPAAQRSKRLLWAHAKLSEKGEPPALPEGHWLNPLRSADRLWIEAGRRSDRFILYDAEIPLAPPVKVTSVEGGYGVINLGRYPLLDVVIYRPEKEGWISASLDRLESTAKPEEKKDENEETKPMPEAVFEDKPDAVATAKAEVDKAAVVEAQKKAEEAKAAAATAKEAAEQSLAGAPVPGAPMPADAAAAPANPAVEEKVINVKAGTDVLSKEQIAAAWRERLIALGLGDSEARYLIQILEKQSLRSDSATIVCRLGEEQLDTLFPLEITPSPDKQIRVAFLVLLDADPDLMNRVEELVKKLGDPSYSEREAAKKRLKELGPAARPKLQEAVNNSDPEISFRAEEIIESFDYPQPGQAVN